MAASCCLSSFDYSIRSRKHVRRNGETDLLGSFEIDDQLEFGWLFHREISWFSTLNNLVCVYG